jgi:hypothetical protein
MFLQDKAKSLDITQVACGSSHVILRSSKDIITTHTNTYHSTGKGQLYSMGTGTEVSSFVHQLVAYIQSIQISIHMCACCVRNTLSRNTVKVKENVMLVHHKTHMFVWTETMLRHLTFCIISTV